MEKLILKYQTLAPPMQREVANFVDFVSSKAKKARPFSLKNWKRKLLNVSVWSTDDIKTVKANGKQLNSWKPHEW